MKKKTKKRVKRNRQTASAFAKAILKNPPPTAQPVATFPATESAANCAMIAPFRITIAETPTREELIATVKTLSKLIP